LEQKKRKIAKISGRKVQIEIRGEILKDLIVFYPDTKNFGYDVSDTDIFSASKIPGKPFDGRLGGTFVSLKR